MLVADIMTTTVVTTTPDARAKDALRQLSDRKVTALPVLDQDKHLVGIVSEADLLREGVVQDPRSTVRRDVGAWLVEGARLVESARTVGEVMTPHVVTAWPNEDVATVVEAMLEHAIRSVPVVLDGRVVGILSRSDVVRALARADDRIAAELTALFEEAGLTGWDCAVEQGEVTLAGGGREDTRLATSLARTITGVRSVSVDAAGPALR